MLKEAALQWQGPLTCNKWDCNCTFTKQRGCCCAANELYSLEDETFIRMKHLWIKIAALNSRVKMLIDGTKIAFKATINPSIGVNEGCFGPFNFNVPIPYGIVSLNDGNGYKCSLGTFTAPCAGVYVFSITVYSSVGSMERLFHQVQLMKNMMTVGSVWENNREDNEDSATQIAVVELMKGDQVYAVLMSGRKLCSSLQRNIFTGYILYPYSDDTSPYYDYSK
ncbi:cerebellin 18 [Acanthochromis polyacanthus]|uniref:cerebellin 18 n=1 Tax=Acanthochromis polyacanthus TaxID=80966 RepID=UPI0022345E53|nr:cerebellin 18 [Acanthochromis polyacanthus]